MILVESGVKCDLCGWSKEVDFENIPTYHGLSCPDCRNSVIITDDDMVQYNVIKGMMALSRKRDHT